VTLLGFCQWLAAQPASKALHESLWVYPLVESVHVIALCLFGGMTVLLDLRLLGVLLRDVPVSAIMRRLGPWMVSGFILVIISGFLLFYAVPVRSYQSIWFRIKVIMLVIAGANALRFHLTTYQSVDTWDLAPPPRRARLSGIASLVLWTGIIVTGRLIAYNWFDCTRQPQTAFVNWAAGCVLESESK
jgi:hypothetical protein